MSVAAFYYRLPGPARGVHPGAHPGRQRGGGLEFRGHATLLAAPDPRRFDAAATLRDPFGRLMIRVYGQRNAIRVRVLADVSASMGFEGRCRKLDVLADFTESLAWSAYRNGDLFAFTACDNDIRPELVQPLSRTRTAGAALAARLRGLKPSGRSAQGLLKAAAQMPAARGLVFVVSDFHFPPALLRALLERLAAHAVVPVVLWDSAEARAPRFGLARLADPETGARRLLLLRPVLAQRLQAAMAQRAQRLIDCCSAFGVRPLFLEDRFDADALTRHFYA
jgi:uncharacterized protein (DUF58 family)